MPTQLDRRPTGRALATGWVLAAALIAGCQGDHWKVWEKLPKFPEANWAFWERSKGPQSEPVPIIDQIGGVDRGLTEQGVLLINSADELARTGSVTASKINVDFESQSLVILAVGRQSTGGYWARILGVHRVGEDVYVHGVVNRPAPNQLVSQGYTYPFYAVVIEKIVVPQLYTDITSSIGSDSPK